MNKIIFATIAVVIITVLSACSHKAQGSKQEKANLEALKAHIERNGLLTIGSGGGFTGAVTQYSIDENGKITRVETYTNDTIEIPPFSTTEMLTMYEQIDSLQLLKVNFSKPGNLYYFIQLNTEDLRHRIAFGHHKQKIDPAIDLFYKNTMQLIRAKEKEM